MGQVQVLYYGTVLAPGEGYDDPRVKSAAGPYAAFQLHLGELGVAGDTAESAAFDQALGEVEESRRHLELHRAHLIDLTELDRPFVTGALIARTTGSGTPDQVRARLSGIAAEGVRGVLYGPMGDDIPGELEAFAEPFVKLLHERLDRAPELSPPGCQPRELRPDADPSGRRHAGQQALGGQRGHDPVHGGPGQAHSLGKLRQAQPLWLPLQGSEHLTGAGDDLYTAGRFRTTHTRQNTSSGNNERPPGQHSITGSIAGRQAGGKRGAGRERPG
jgi:hypothetical protein